MQSCRLVSFLPIYKTQWTAVWNCERCKDFKDSTSSYFVQPASRWFFFWSFSWCQEVPMRSKRLHQTSEGVLRFLAEVYGYITAWLVLFILFILSFANQWKRTLFYSCVPLLNIQSWIDRSELHFYLKRLYFFHFFHLFHCKSLKSWLNVTFSPYMIGKFSEIHVLQLWKKPPRWLIH